MAGNAHFPKCAKLLKPAEFKQVFNAAKRAGDRHLTIFYHANERNQPRLGLAISKKVSKLAVERNRIKRLARETFRLKRHELQFADFVVLAKPGAVKVENKELIASFNKLWNKLQHRQDDTKPANTHA
ncbi:MAG: ribonuclease P protein component [Gammaproteobacteria bacterium]|nr:ribonuclease P protein component [Gammaproteobacteria bacterium]